MFTENPPVASSHARALRRALLIPDEQPQRQFDPDGRVRLHEAGSNLGVAEGEQFSAAMTG